MGRRELPVIACSLDAEGQARRARDIRDLLASSLVERADLGGGARLVFEPSAAERARTLFEAERECCPYWTITTNEVERGLAVTITGPAEAAPILRALLGA